jgi:hypothetical protein
MPATYLGATERLSFQQQVDNADIESESARLYLKGLVNIIEVPGGAYTADKFSADFGKAVARARVETAVSSRFDHVAGLVGGGYVNGGDPRVLDLGQMETRIITSTVDGGPIFTDIKDKVQTRAREVLADRHIDYFLSRTLNTSEDYITDLRVNHPIAYREDFADLIRNRTQQVITRRVEGIKTQLDAGTLTEAQVSAMIGGGGSIQNPQLKAAIQKMLDDPERAKVRKEAADKTTMNTDAANFKTELDATGINNDFEVDFDDLTTRITGLPEYANLSGPVRAMVEAHMANKNEMIENKRAQADLKDVVNDATVREKAVERNRAFVALALRRLQWIGIGALAGGSIAALLSGGNIWLTGLVAGVGAAGSMGLAHAFDVDLATRAKELAQSQSKLIEQQNQRTVLMSQRHTAEGESVKTFTKIAALVEALTKGLDKDKAVSTYLKTCSVDALEDLLAV